MSKFELILKHFDFNKRDSRKIKKVIRRTENDKKRKTKKSHETKEVEPGNCKIQLH